MRPGRRALEGRDARHEPRRRRHQLVERRRRELRLPVEGLAAEADRVLVPRADDERVADLAPVPLLGGVVDRARHLLEARQAVQQARADRHREHGQVDADLGGEVARARAGREDDRPGAAIVPSPEPDAGDPAALGQEARRARVGQDAPAAVADARQQARDAVGGIGVAAVRLPRRRADSVRLHERQEPLHARRVQHLGGHPHRLHQRHVLLERRDEDRRHDEQEAVPAVAVLATDLGAPRPVHPPALDREVGLGRIGVVAADVARGPTRGAAGRKTLVDDRHAEARARREAGRARAGDAGADDHEIDGLPHDRVSYLSRCAFRTGRRIRRGRRS